VIEYESALWKHGFETLAGVDEVGRGALAGPVVAAAVACADPDTICRLQADPQATLIRDSKRLTHSQRLVALRLIERYVTAWQIGLATVEEIDVLGIAAANRLAMERGIESLAVTPSFLLIDAMTVESDLCQWGLIDGDDRSLLIAAASIVAKVTRDDMMAAYEREHCAYTFSRHRGYGTAAHLSELRANGPCILHRTSFDPVRRLLRDCS
jgi:ribonuclease HII